MRTTRCLTLTVLAAILVPVALVRAAAPALPNAHAHNDYLHARPLLDALDLGFTSVEADVWLIGDKLLVGHSLPELRPYRTLEVLYLEPLARRVGENGGWVYEVGRTVTLLVDFKTNAAATYPALKKRLAAYPQLFSPTPAQKPTAARSVTPPSNEAGAPPIRVIISGDRPTPQFLAADPERIAAYDGRLSDFTSEAAPDVMPLVSDNWANHFKWQGRGPMPAAERQKLREFSQRAHAKGRQLRFWATPDNEAMWAELAAAGVDLIAADDLEKLARFLRAIPLPRREGPGEGLKTKSSGNRSN